MNTLLILLAILALSFALFAWATGSNQNATRRARIGNASRKFSRAHFRQFYLAPLLFQRVKWWFGGTAPKSGGIQFANIGEGTYHNGVKSYLPDATTTSRYLCYKIGATSADYVAVCGAGDVPLGTSDDQADSGVPIAIKLFGVKPGTLRVVTDGSIGNGDHVKCAASGQVTKASSTDVSFGIAIIGTDASAAAGDTIAIIHAVPHKYVF